MTITPAQCVQYSCYLADLKVIEKCCRKNLLARLAFVNDRFVELSQDQSQYTSATLKNRFSPVEIAEIDKRLKVVNEMHRILKTDLSEEFLNNDCARCTTEIFKANSKMIDRWNATFST